jgi:hypothetical protein
MKTHSSTTTKARSHAFFESGDLHVDERDDGYYWNAKGSREMHGPFGSLVDALDDIQQRAGSDLIGEPEDWIDDVGYEAAYPA